MFIWLLTYQFQLFIKSSLDFLALIQPLPCTWVLPPPVVLTVAVPWKQVFPVLWLNKCSQVMCYDYVSLQICFFMELIMLAFKRCAKFSVSPAVFSPHIFQMPWMYKMTCHLPPFSWSPLSWAPGTLPFWNSCSLGLCHLQSWDLPSRLS